MIRQPLNWSFITEKWTLESAAYKLLSAVLHLLLRILLPQDTTHTLSTRTGSGAYSGGGFIVRACFCTEDQKGATSMPTKPREHFNHLPQLLSYSGLLLFNFQDAKRKEVPEANATPPTAWPGCKTQGSPATTARKTSPRSENVVLQLTKQYRPLAPSA